VAPISTNMNANQYIFSVLRRYAVSYRPPAAALKMLYPLISTWARPYLLRIIPSGSFAKKTAIAGGSDIDLFISLSPRAPELHEIYDSLAAYLEARGFPIREENVSIRVAAGGVRVDLVPARKQLGNTSDHSLYLRKRNSWTKTNVFRHVSYIKNSGRIAEIKALKIWRQLIGLDFPSFYLELAVINALRQQHARNFNLENNLIIIYEYLASNFLTALAIDPANTNNVVSNDLTDEEKKLISEAAESSLRQPWEMTIW